MQYALSHVCRPTSTRTVVLAGIDGKVIDTTLAKMVCGKFTVDGAVKLVLVFHCKSFKKDAQKQGAFIAFALKTAAEIFGGVAYAAGGMNIEASVLASRRPERECSQSQRPRTASCLVKR